MATTEDVLRESIHDECGKETDRQNELKDEGRFYDALGFNLDDLYRLSYRFFKEKEGSKALHATYKDKLKLVALTKQIAFGKYRPDAMPEVGFFDVVGNDRKQAWQSLGEMPREKAMTEFVVMVKKLSPLFMPYIKAHLAEKEELEQKKKEEAKRLETEVLEQIQLEEAAKQQEAERQRQVAQEMLIRAALNKQTSVQFRQYAEQQYSGNLPQQEALISQLQEQHFIQYMQQVYQQQLQLQQQQLQSNIEQKSSSHPAFSIGMSSNGVFANGNEEKNNSQFSDVLGHSALSNASDVTETRSPEPQDEAAFQENGLLMSHDGIIDPNDLPPIAAASMWTRKDIKEFKESLKSDSESVIKVGSGELVTVRVPTHDDGSCLFWEFATDSYDIGFGVYFEWTMASSNEMSVQTNESSEDDEDEDNVNHQHDAESHDKNQENEPPTDEIIPAYRRDCHEEVYCGSHVYPGRGVYLLKFDNSYSLWRGKTVYYRVYYTR